MMVSKIYKEHILSASQKNTENNNSIKMYCFDLTTTFIIFNTGYFNCFPEPYTHESGVVDIDYVY